MCLFIYAAASSPLPHSSQTEPRSLNHTSKTHVSDLTTVVQILPSLKTHTNVYCLFPPPEVLIELEPMVRHFDEIDILEAVLQIQRSKVSPKVLKKILKPF